MLDIALLCRGLVKRYADVTALDGLDLEVHAGECFGMLGPNGAGKTTTIEILQGLLQPDAGRVEVLGHAWRTHERELRQRMGTQLQETKLPDKLTVEEVVALFRSFYRRGKSVDQVLEEVQLLEKRGAWVSRLSGGQRQRLAVACALVSEPDVLFLDEPTTGLDPQSRRQMWGIIERFRSHGGTTLLTTHYMEEAEHLCDRVAIVDHGRVIALGTPRQLIESLGAEHVVEFAIDNDVLVPDEVYLDLSGVQGVAHDDGKTRLTASHVHLVIPDLMRVLERRGATLDQLTTHHATLEDVFLSLTGRHLRDG
ncbi:MAG: ABC transporter ATP-binding protein [Gemmatimonadota bacterium]|nr:ABC transporter ATP-binding protein [Gemmatimonadota bacterium]MDH5551479.1 ABC transporter ATP-binding protein [Gemmatimonadota bacterium]